MLSKNIDLVISHEAIGKAAAKHPSGSYIKKLRKLGSAFAERVFCRQLRYQLHRSLRETALTVEVHPEQLRKEVPDKDPRAIYIYYPSSLAGTQCPYGVIKINCSFLSAAFETV